VNERDRINAVINRINNPTKKEDKRNWLLRLLCSLKLSIKPGQSVKKPIKEINLTGGIDF